MRQGRGSHQRATIDHRTRALCEQTSSSRSREAKVSPTSEGQTGDFFYVMQALERLNERAASMETTVSVVATAKTDQMFVANILHNWVVEPLVCGERCGDIGGAGGGGAVFFTYKNMLL